MCRDKPETMPRCTCRKVKAQNDTYSCISCVYIMGSKVSTNILGTHEWCLAYIHAVGRDAKGW